MNYELIYNPLALVVGVGATLCMDLWAVLSYRILGFQRVNWCLVGRWLSGLAEGRLINDNINTKPKAPGECALGWNAHYLVGVLLSCLFLAIVGEAWLAAPTLWPPLLFGWTSVVLPFFLMQPGMGAGIAGSKTPYPTRVRLRSLLTHTVYGLGLFLAAKAVSVL